METRYEYFAAEDDTAATAMLSTDWEQPTYCGELPVTELDDLESLLTGRSIAEIAADPRYGAQVAELVDEDADVTEGGVVAVTDSLTRALATADAATLAEVGADWHDEAEVQGLAAVARQAIQRGHHVYCFFWYL
jgi:hypothetical protein